MRLGNLNNKILIILISLYFSPLLAERQIDLKNIKPTFEEEPENLDEIETGDLNYMCL